MDSLSGGGGSRDDDVEGSPARFVVGLWTPDVSPRIASCFGEATSRDALLRADGAAHPDGRAEIDGGFNVATAVKPWKTSAVVAYKRAVKALREPVSPTMGFWADVEVESDSEPGLRWVRVVSNAG